MRKSRDQLHPEFGSGELLGEELPPVRHVVADGLVEGFVEHASDALDRGHRRPRGGSLGAACLGESFGNVGVVLEVAWHAVQDGGNGVVVELAQGGRMLRLDSASGKNA